MSGYTLNVLIALEEGERLTRAWWPRRYQWGDVRAGGMPPEVADPKNATVAKVTDPDTGDRYASVTFTLPPQTELGRARELAHLLTSMLAAEGYTLRQDGKRLDPVPDMGPAAPVGSLGDPEYTKARVCSDKCLTCVFMTETRWGCCSQGAGYSLADIGAALLDGEAEFVATLLALPGEQEGSKWQPYLKGGICVFHSPDKGCTLPLSRMPLQCRTYLCAPERLLPTEVLAEYKGYVDALDEAEEFIGEHMRYESGVDFDSPLAELKAAAAKAFAAWKA